jgi:L-lactate dehydrogenase complex protein LldE
VSVPESQTCCRQPAFNSGDNLNAAAIARNVIEAFESFDAVVAPSGSCAGMIRVHFPELLKDDLAWADRANALASKTYELVSYLVDERGMTGVDAHFEGHVAYHDACSGLRELGVRPQPRQLLSSIEGLTVSDLKDKDVCCGFGGTFAAKYGDISTAMVAKKTGQIVNTGADVLLAGDLGCLMNIAGRLSREGRDIRCFHVAEVLAGMADGRAIGEGEG